MTQDRELTTQELRLVSVLLSDPDQEWYGLQVAEMAGLKSGTVYLVLNRLENQYKWLESRPENIDPSVEGRPRRRLYRLSPEGRRCAEAAVYEHMAVLGIASGNVGSRRVAAAGGPLLRPAKPLVPGARATPAT